MAVQNAAPIASTIAPAQRLRRARIAAKIAPRPVAAASQLEPVRYGRPIEMTSGASSALSSRIQLVDQLVECSRAAAPAPIGVSTKPKRPSAHVGPKNDRSFPVRVSRGRYFTSPRTTAATAGDAASNCPADCVLRFARYANASNNAIVPAAISDLHDSCPMRAGKPTVAGM